MIGEMRGSEKKQGKRMGVHRLIISKWLADKKGIPRFFRGYIQARTDKAIKIDTRPDKSWFMGHDDSGIWIPKSQFEFVYGPGYYKENGKIKCSLCDSEIVKKHKKTWGTALNDWFWACSNYPTCNNILSGKACKNCGAFTEEKIQLCPICIDEIFKCPICGERIDMEKFVDYVERIPHIQPSHIASDYCSLGDIHLVKFCPACTKEEAEKFKLEKKKELSDKCEICGTELLLPFSIDHRKEIQEKSRIYLDEEYPIKIIHHTSYSPEKTISVCPSCHQKIHKTDEYPDKKPDGGGDKDGKGKERK